ncbi:MAG: hypothetical protein KatS3mg062_0046 [Tepidiforma sp.]|nr:MAG: hypothetical protein KatS3mg062_0046 [Tepidiforma sp.]
MPIRYHYGEVDSQMTQAFPDGPAQCVIFRTGGTRQALPIDVVREILVPGDLTPAPGSPPEVLGLTQVRGQALPVIDLAKRLGLAAAPIGPERRLVVAAWEGQAVALLVDGVDEVTTVYPDDFEVVRVPGRGGCPVLKRGESLVGWLEVSELIQGGYEAGRAAA